jgi:hypothetical protein
VESRSPRREAGKNDESSAAEAKKGRNHDAKFTERVFKGSLGHRGRIGCG